MKILVVYTSESFSFPDSLANDSVFDVEFSVSKIEASEKVHLYEYDCVLFYLSSDGKDWQTFLYDLTQASKSNGIILLSNEISVEQKVKSLNAGVDDCLILPIHPAELKARILAIVRRKKFNTRHQINFANTIIDLEQRQVLVWDTLIALTPKEYDILLYFIMNRNKIVSPVILSDYLWGDSSEDKESGNLLIAHIKNLRKKLKQAKAEVEIKNIYATGYQIIEL